MLEADGLIQTASGKEVLRRYEALGMLKIRNMELTVRSWIAPIGIWQRALQEQLGLSLESQKAAVRMLIVDSALRVPPES